MSSQYESLFSRIEYIVDCYYGGNKSKFGQDVGISGQYVSKWQKEFEREGKDPNPSYKVIETIISKLNINPVWLLLGIGSPEIDTKAVFSEKNGDKVDEALFKYLYHKSTVGFSSNDRNLLIEYLQEQIEGLSKGLDLLRQLGGDFPDDKI